MPVDVQQLKQRATAVLGGFSTGQKVVSVLAIVGLFVGLILGFVLVIQRFRDL